MRRALTASMWFVAFLCVHELAWSLFGSPRILGLAFGAAGAAFVLMDPVGLIDRRHAVTREGPAIGGPEPSPSRL
ncbi:MAG TPA: hypothetical protein VFV72_08620 [Candidatus Limnocylindrales bacterium]|nr:hypothetical protein [Candidatus Limnocylindrales bacterium]